MKNWASPWNAAAVEIVLPADVEKLVRAAEPVHIKMEEIALAAQLVHDRERRADDAPVDLQSPRQTAHERRFSRVKPFCLRLQKKEGCVRIK